MLTFFLPNYPQDARFLTEEERKVILERLPSTSPQALSKAFSWREIKSLLRSATFYTYSFIWICHGIGGWGISFVLPSVVYELGFGKSSSKAQLMTIPPAALTFVVLNILGILIQKRIFNGFFVAATLELIQITSYIVLITIDNTVGKYLISPRALVNLFIPCYGQIGCV